MLDSDGEGTTIRAAMKVLKGTGVCRRGFGPIRRIKQINLKGVLILTRKDFVFLLTRVFCILMNYG